MRSFKLDELLRRLLSFRKNIFHTLNAEKNKAQQRLVFVAGVQRSGTNMMMDVLEKSYETDVYHERDERAFNNYEMRDVAVVKKLLDRSKAPCFIIKSLCELQDLNQLMKEFSPAKVVWVSRHYDDVSNSMLVSFKNQAKQVKRIVERRSSEWWLGKGMSDETYAILKKLVHSAISDASSAALIWYFRSVLFFEQGFDRNSQVQLVQYENLVAEPQQEFARIFHFLNLDYSQRLSRKVFASSVRKREQLDIDAPIREMCDELILRFDAVATQQRRYFKD